MFYECDKGWYRLIDSCLKEVQELYDRNKTEFEVLQVKEKFGQLRIYLNNYINGSHEILERYSKLSTSICEVCGEKGCLCVKGRFLKILCDKHRVEYGYKTVKTMESGKDEGQ